jgi:hypothetical protein
MKTPTRKTFDCVQMKRDIQQRLMDEYQANAQPGETYLQYLQRTNRHDAGVQKLRDSLRFRAEPND